MTIIKVVSFEHRSFIYIQKRFLKWKWWKLMAEGGSIMKNDKGEYLETNIRIYQ